MNKVLVLLSFFFCGWSGLKTDELPWGRGTGLDRRLRYIKTQHLIGPNHVDRINSGGSLPSTGGMKPPM